MGTDEEHVLELARIGHVSETEGRIAAIAARRRRLGTERFATPLEGRNM